MREICDAPPIFKYVMKFACFGFTVHLRVYVSLKEEVSSKDYYFMRVFDTADETNLYFNIRDNTGYDRKRDLIKDKGLEMCKEIIDMLDCVELHEFIDEYALYSDLQSKLSLHVTSDSESECECI
jgi:hypothetical protein